MPNRPNVLWIIVEDTSAQRLGCYGDDVARTPNIDQLAADGRRYTNAFSTAPACSPSRNAIITGRYATTNGGHHLRTVSTPPATKHTPGLPVPYNPVPAHYVRVFSEYFRQNGYYCTNNGKVDYQFDLPFTAWNECSTDAHWRGRDGDQPFFAVFNNTVTHESGMHDPVEGGHIDEPKTDPSSLELPPYLPDTEKVRLALARHYDNLEQSDKRIGEILRRLDEDDIADETVVFILSDHGDGLPRYKRWLYDGGIRVPLIVRWPGEISPNTVSNELVSLIDLPATTLSVAGIDVPPYFHGSPFFGANADSRTYVYAHRDRLDESYDMVRAVRDTRFKYIRHYSPGTPYIQWMPYRNRHPIMEEIYRLADENELDEYQTWFTDTRPSEELYDLDSDPHETNNVVDDPAYADELDRLRTSLDEWERRTNDLGHVAETQMKFQMEQGGEPPTTATPTFIPNTASNRKRRATPEGGEFSHPVRLSIHCSTQGASIGYTMDSGEDADWDLYSEPLDLPHGTTSIRAKAVRIGYEESNEREATFHVT